MKWRCPYDLHLIRVYIRVYLTHSIYIHYGQSLEILLHHQISVKKH